MHKDVPEQNELYHFGVLGMKWGKRNAQQTYSSETMSDSKKNKASKLYKKDMVKAEATYLKKASRLDLDAYNKTAIDYNSVKINEFNKKHNPKDKGYDEKLQKAFDKDLSKTTNKMHLDEITNDKNYKKAQELVKKYDMLKYDDLAKDNDKFINEIKKYL